MRILPMPSLLAGLILLAGVATLAEEPQVQRQVGSDGVPILSIKGQRATPAQSHVAPPPVRKEFRVYDLEPPVEEPSVPEAPNVLIVAYPPPIAPSSAGFYGYGFPGYPGWGVCPGGGWGPGYSPGFVSRGSGYQNYTNPPANYRPLPFSNQSSPRFR